MSNPGLNDVVGYWKFDEVSGNRLDSHSNGYTLTDGSAVGYDSGKISNAAKFVRTSNDYLTRGTEAALNPTGSFSWITWLKVDSIPNHMDLIATRASTDNYTIYIANTELIRVSHSVGSTHRTIDGSSYGTLPTDGSWVMIYGEFDVDDHVGVSVNAGTLDTLGVTGSWDINLGGIYFGRNPGGYNYYDGLMDETVMFNRILTPAEVTWMYNSGSGRTYGDLAPPPGVIFSDDFESGDTSEWDSTVGTDIDVVSGAAIRKDYGLEIDITDTSQRYVRDNSPNGETRYRARYYFDPNSITMGQFKYFDQLILYDSVTPILFIRFREGVTPDILQLHISTRDDASSFADGSSWRIIDDEPVCIEFDWKASSGPGNDDGYLIFWINDVEQANITGIDNDTRTVGSVWLGAPGTINSGISGPFFIDEFVSNNSGDYIGPIISVEDLTISPIVGTPSISSVGTNNLISTGITITPEVGTPTTIHVPVRVYPHAPEPPRADTPVYILDPGSMEIFGMIEDYYSLIWTERYNESGEFELEVPIEYDEDPLLAFGNLLYIKDSDKLMIVEDIKPSVTEEKSSLLVKGQSTESLLTRRVLLDDLNVEGVAETIIYSLLETNLTNAVDTDRNMGILKTTFPSVSTTATFKDQLKMQSVYEAVKYICKTSVLGFKFEKVGVELAFSVYEGLNRSYDQSENTYVIFSDNFDNVVSSSFYLSEKDKINVVLVATKVLDQYHEEEYAPSLERVFVWSASEPTDVDRYETVLETEVKRTINPNPPPLVEEPKVPDNPILGITTMDLLTPVGITVTPTMGVNTNEAQPDPPPPEVPLTDSEVLSIIATRGDEILDTWKSVGLFEGDFDIHGNFKYGTDFFMGDIVQCNLEGRNVKARIVELVRSYAVDGLKTYVAFDFII